MLVTYVALVQTTLSWYYLRLGGPDTDPLFLILLTLPSSYIVRLYVQEDISFNTKSIDTYTTYILEYKEYVFLKLLLSLVLVVC